MPAQNKIKPPEVLTAKRLREIARDDIDAPSLRTFLIIEGCEWLVYLAIALVIVFLVKAAFETVWRFVMPFLN